MRSNTPPCQRKYRRDDAKMPLQIIVACALLIPACAHAAGDRFAINAAASLQRAAAAQSGERFELHAALAAPTAAPQSALGYSLTAHIAAQPLVCTSDTIFEDGFDG